MRQHLGSFVLPAILSLLALGACDVVPGGGGDDECGPNKPCANGNECVSGVCQPVIGAPDVSVDTGNPDPGKPDVGQPKPDTGNPNPTGCGADVDCEGAFPNAPACKTARCEMSTHKCKLVSAADGTECEAATACDDGGTCQAGKCVVSGEVDCDDGNPCTKDDCDPEAGCQHKPKGGSCDDGNPCTSKDKCDGGVCVGEGLTCDDSNPCTDDTCNDGECLYTPNTAVCDDGDNCTINDACSNGACAGGAAVVCGDGNPCTDDWCDSATGECEHDDNYALCDDGNACTTEDSCQDGVCQGLPVICDDDDLCTYDTCDPATGGCEHNICMDGDACTIDDCEINMSENGPVGNCDFTPAKCNDGDPCTIDFCNENFQSEDGPGCVFQPVLYPCKCTSHEECEDGDSCTVDICQYGVCQHHKKKCGDGDPTTYDYCDPGIGAGLIIPGGDPLGDKIDNCVHVIPNLGGKPGPCENPEGCGKPGSALDYCNTDKDCDSGTACVTDVCVDHWCQHTPVECVDENEWTNDWCHKYLGCIHTTVKGCIADDDCFDGNSCTIDLCDPTTGKCNYDEVNCYDDPTSNPLSLCTKDWCDPYDSDGNGQSGCMNDLDMGCWSCVMGIPVDGVEPCDDGNACTIDHCQTEEGLCIHTPVNCDDHNPCTTDACDPDVGCTYHLNNAPCNDYNNCTLVDQCINGLCIGSVLSKCEDGNPCTEDFCDPWANCKHVTDIGECDDGDPCTADYCNPVSGCTNIAFDGPCSDGDPCTENTVCSGGVCSGSPVQDCIPDSDQDEIKDPDDNCPYHWNHGQDDADGDGLGDACDDDADGDGVANAIDNCPLIANPEQEDANGDGVGDVCYPDTDGDGVHDDTDNCQIIPNAGQQDMDADGMGDLCDDDRDGDGLANTDDNCPNLENLDQADFDGDKQGDACDADDDNDGTIDELDCEPHEPAVAPNFPETCNGWDDNCDGQIDGLNSAGCNFQAPDVDQDGFGTADTTEWECTCWKKWDWSNYLSDCNDNQPFISPAAADDCDGIDNNCNGQVDEGCE